MHCRGQPDHGRTQQARREGLTGLADLDHGKRRHEHRHGRRRLVPAGRHHVSSYLRRFAIPNVLCALIGAGIGLSQGGFLGLASGVVLGIAAPVALIWLAVTVVHAAAYLVIFSAVWAALYYLIRWHFQN